MSKFQKYFTPLGINVTEVLKKFPGCSYIGQFPGGRRTSTGDIEFRDAAVDVFYQPNPDKSLGHTNYFSMFVHHGSVYIANADYVTDLCLTGVTDSEGDILYARYQHDFRYTFDKKYAVDGGWWVKDNVTKNWVMHGRIIGGEDGTFPNRVSINIGVENDSLFIL